MSWSTKVLRGVEVSGYRAAGPGGDSRGRKHSRSRIGAGSPGDGVGVDRLRATGREGVVIQDKRVGGDGGRSQEDGGESGKQHI